RLHAYFGLLSKFKGKTVPYRELFHIGGPSSVRGFLFGEVGPQFLGDSIGGNKAFFVNVELAFPITPDFNMKGVVFYDGGSGWDNPYSCSISKELVTHNSFNFRHSVGVGIRLLNPMPIRIDWGFKLDRNKKLKETASEVHFSMTYDF
ncbi:BamA/TamA family outer membrane protein, partial [bacterium]|nr:BamA/TamA family outer membrane protein [bacterium]